MEEKKIHIRIALSDNFRRFLVIKFRFDRSLKKESSSDEDNEQILNDYKFAVHNLKNDYNLSDDELDFVDYLENNKKESNRIEKLIRMPVFVESANIKGYHKVWMSTRIRKVQLN